MIFCEIKNYYFCKVFGIKSSLSDLGRTVEEIRLLRATNLSGGDGVVPLRVEPASTSADLKELNRRITESLVCLTVKPLKRGHYTLFKTRVFMTKVCTFKLFGCNIMLFFWKLSELNLINLYV